MVAGFKSERVAGFNLECMAGFVLPEYSPDLNPHGDIAVSTAAEIATGFMFK